MGRIGRLLLSQRHTRGPPIVGTLTAIFTIPRSGRDTKNEERVMTRTHEHKKSGKQAYDDRPLTPTTHNGQKSLERKNQSELVS